MNWVAAVLLLLAAAAVCYGVWLLLPAAAFITGGVLALFAGIASVNVGEKEADQ